jgi:hypothetical protein
MVAVNKSTTGRQSLYILESRCDAFGCVDKRKLSYAWHVHHQGTLFNPMYRSMSSRVSTPTIVFPYRFGSLHLVTRQRIQ